MKEEQFSHGLTFAVLLTRVGAAADERTEES
jgi:hypothetical protein